MKVLSIEERDGSGKRIVTTIGTKKCPLGCIYCFVDNENYPGLPSLDTDSAQRLLSRTTRDIDLIQPATDVEIFLVPNVIQRLESLAQLGRSISFATKWKVGSNVAAELARINHGLANRGEILQIAVSLSRLHAWQELERFTPSPFDRIATLKRLYELGIPTTVALRPILPFVEEAEIREIVALTHNYCYAYLSGPTYMTPALKQYMRQKGVEISSSSSIVPWMPGSPSMEVVHSPHLEQVLRSVADTYGLPVFDDNIRAVLYLKGRQASLIAANADTGGFDSD